MSKKSAKTKRTKKMPAKVHLPRSIRRMFPKVKYAIDGTDSIEISVQRCDTGPAEALNPAECALAKAIKREYKADGAVVGLSASYVIKGDTAVRYQTPASVQREIVSFDRHHDFSEGTYHLPPKSPSTRFGAYRGKPGGDPHNTGKQMKHVRFETPKVRVLAKGKSSS